jgi:hypothetical protein
MNISFTDGSKHDISIAEKILAFFKGIAIGDKAYISKALFQKLHQKGIELVTGIRANMKNVLIHPNRKLLLKKRSLIESVFGYLKQIFMIEHHRHRSVINMFVHVISTLIAYQLKSRKPAISEILTIS